MKSATVVVVVVVVFAFAFASDSYWMLQRWERHGRHPQTGKTGYWKEVRVKKSKGSQL
jgi:hypothetical protein